MTLLIINSAHIAVDRRLAITDTMGMNVGTTASKFFPLMDFITVCYGDLTALAWFHGPDGPMIASSGRKPPPLQEDTRIAVAGLGVLDVWLFSKGPRQRVSRIKGNLGIPLVLGATSDEVVAAAWRGRYEEAFRLESQARPLHVSSSYDLLNLHDLSLRRCENIGHTHNVLESIYGKHE